MQKTRLRPLRSEVMKIKIALFAGLACFVILRGETQVSADEAKTGSSGSGSATPAMQTASELKTSDPIVKPFQDNFDKCASQASGGGDGSSSGGAGCTFENLGIQPSAAHLATSAGSCHNIGKAIDVGKVNCGGSMKDPKTDHDFYNKVADCFADAPEVDGKKFNKVIYDFADGNNPNVVKSAKGDHDQHIHIQWDCEYGDGAGQGAAAAK